MRLSCRNIIIILDLFTNKKQEMFLNGSLFEFLNLYIHKDIL